VNRVTSDDGTSVASEHQEHVVHPGTLALVLATFLDG
jgi:hypothetical protein